MGSGGSWAFLVSPPALAEGPAGGSPPGPACAPLTTAGVCGTGHAVPAATRPRWPRPPFPRCRVTVTSTRPWALPPRCVPISSFVCCLLLRGGIFNLLITL